MNTRSNSPVVSVCSFRYHQAADDIREALDSRVLAELSHLR
jgi:hypothetical protein